jgi:hypothetical protein
VSADRDILELQSAYQSAADKEKGSVLHAV